MKAALISPIPDLWRTPKTGIHLVLAHLLDNPDYVTFYQERRNRGDYLVLDNSAHELGVGQGHIDLFAKAQLIGAQEIVLPDILFDRYGTVERTKQMLRWITQDGWEPFYRAGRPRMMIVPQAKERADWAVCLRNLLNVWDTYAARTPEPLESPVIGISKDYDDWRGGLAKLIRDYIAKLFDERDLDVHCLGWPNNLWSIASVAREFPWVRSTDSAKPFVFAKNGIQLEPGGRIPKYPRRNRDYFSDRLGNYYWEIALRNAEVFKAAAENKLIFEHV